MKYRVRWAYRSSLGGPWQEGEIVELTEELAGRINLDSPVVLIPHEREEWPKQNRQIVAAEKRTAEPEPEPEPAKKKASKKKAGKATK